MAASSAARPRFTATAPCRFATGSGLILTPSMPRFRQFVGADPAVGDDRIEPAVLEHLESRGILLDDDQPDARVRLQELPGQAAAGDTHPQARQIRHAGDAGP